MTKKSEHAFNWSQISAFRLTRHHFVDQNQVDLPTICQNVCGIQAQLMAAAEMQLWARRHDPYGGGLTRADIRSALLESRALVKTSLMRQTLHLIPAADFSIYISALKKSRSEGLQRIMSKYAGITQKETAALNEAIVEALRAGPMTQPELMEQIMPKAGKKVRTWMELAWSIQVFRSALVEGLICYGPERGKKATFVRVDQWLPQQRAVDEQEAKQILLRRYLRAYGPATLRDFSKWSGISTKEAREAWESMEDELVGVHVEDQKRFILHEDYDQLTTSHLDDQILRLLPHFDPYLLGHADKDHLVDASYYKRVYRNQGWISPVVLLNGRVIGVWSYARRGKGLLFEVELFEKLSKTIRARIEEEAASLGDFLEMPWEIQFSVHLQ
jgi:uncharacterized protein YcaQ